MRLSIAAPLAAFLLLAGCTGQETPDDPPATATPSPSASPTPEAIDYAAVCDSFAATITLPNDDTLEYPLEFNEPTGWATNESGCEIEPELEYYDAAAEAGVFGRADLDVGRFTEEQARESGFQEYDSENAAALLTLTQVEPGNIDHDEPCTGESCEDFLRSYRYTFEFETIMDDVGVIAKFDYITTDTSGEQEEEYRDQAITAFNTTMDVIADTIQ